jgi:hypothetical protein
MVVKNKKPFAVGIVLTVSFLVVLVLMFVPLFEGHNALVAADQLFNSISKGSTYFIPKLKKEGETFAGQNFDVALKAKNKENAEQMAKQLKAAGATVNVSDTDLKVSGDLGRVVAAALADSDAMFHNREDELTKNYGYAGKTALLAWWGALKEMNKDLTRQKSFKPAAFIAEAIKKGVEPAYNFFGIAPQTASSRAGILVFSLVFYVAYTLWWGMAILYLFDGLGLELKAGAKKEM